MKESALSLKENTTQHWFFYFQITHKYWTSFMTDLLNIIFDDFRIWLLGYRIDFNCVYIPQGHYFISTLWLWSTDEYVIFLILTECPPLKGSVHMGTLFSTQTATISHKQDELGIICHIQTWQKLMSKQLFKFHFSFFRGRQRSKPYKFSTDTGIFSHRWNTPLCWSLNISVPYKLVDDCHQLIKENKLNRWFCVVLFCFFVLSIFCFVWQESW